MKTIKLFLVAVIALLFCLACDSKPPTEVDAITHKEKALKYYGFAVVDCGWDDTNDGYIKTHYVDEVSGFTNANQMCIYEPDEDLLNVH